MALPNKPLGELKAVRDPEVVEKEVDILIVGGGMAACGTAFEMKKWLLPGQSVLLVDKAAMERYLEILKGSVRADLEGESVFTFLEQEVLARKPEVV